MREAQLAAPASPCPAATIWLTWTSGVSRHAAPICMTRPSRFGSLGRRRRAGRPAGDADAARGRPGDPGRSRLAAGADLLPPHTPAGLQPAGPVTLEGIARWRGGVERRLGWRRPTSPRQRRWFGWDIPAMEQALGSELVPVVSCSSVRRAPAGLPQARAGRRSTSPTTISAMRSPGTGSPWRWLVIYILFSIPSRMHPSREADPPYRRRRRRPDLCPDRPGCRRADHQFRPVLPRLADLLRSLGAAAVGHRGHPEPRLQLWAGDAGMGASPDRGRARRSAGAGAGRADLPAPARAARAGADRRCPGRAAAGAGALGGLTVLDQQQPVVGGHPSGQRAPGPDGDPAHLRRRSPGGTGLPARSGCSARRCWPGGWRCSR